jgi:hypothetical protein
MAQGSRARIVLFAGFGLFVAVLIYLVAASLKRRSAPEFSVSPVGVPLTRSDSGITVTLDARDENAWRYLDLDRAIALPPGDSSDWDLAVRRFHIRVAPAGDLGRWYHYGMLSHLLESTGRLYPVQTSGGQDGTVEVLSYYCPGLEAGCLTLRYRPGPDPHPAP